MRSGSFSISSQVARCSCVALGLMAARQAALVFHQRPSPPQSSDVAGWQRPGTVTSVVLMVILGNGTFVPRIVLMRGCDGGIPATEWGLAVGFIGQGR
jgi:hypothetical protein